MNITNDVLLEKIENVKTDTGEIKNHLKDLNGTVKDHSVKLARVKSHKFYGWLITFISSASTFIIGSLLTAIYFLQR